MTRRHTHYQFERQGYFVRDTDSLPDALVFNRTITLRDTWGTADTAATQPRTRRQTRPTPPPEPTRDVTAEFSTAEVARFTELVKRGVGHEEAAVLAKDEALGAYYSEAAQGHASPQLANWVVGEVAREREGDTFKVPPPRLAELVSLVDDGTLSTRLAKEVFAEMAGSGQAAGEIVAARGLEQVSDAGALEPLVDALVARHPDKVDAYRGGKTGLLGFFVGQLMRETKGQANPQLAQALVKRKLG